jgi:hypothetical protein
MGWRLPAHCTEGLRMAGRSLHLNPSRDFWAHDLLQAGRIALWERSPDCVNHAYTVARSAMIDELRRVTPGARTVNEEGGRGIKATFCEWDAQQDHRPFTDTPDRVLEAAQTLAAMEALAPGWAEALALSENLAAAGRRMGRTESRACQVRRWLQVCAT